MSQRELIDPKNLAGSPKVGSAAPEAPEGTVSPVQPAMPAPTPYPNPAPGPVHDPAFFAQVLPYSKSAAVAGKVKEAEAALVDLERELGPAALAATLGEAGGAKKLAALEQQVASARGAIITLKIALESALEADARELGQMQAAAYTTQLRSVSLHLGRRDTAAEKLAAALEIAAKEYRTMIDQSFEARKCCPARVRWPDGSLCEVGKLERLVGLELFRISGAKVPGDQSGLRDALPGAVAPPAPNNQPHKIPPFVETLAAASKRTMDTLTGGTRIWEGGPGRPKAVK